MMHGSRYNETATMLREIEAEERRCLEEREE